jgi:hypothetical protein
VRVCRTAYRFAVLPCGTPGSGGPRSFCCEGLDEDRAGAET